MSGDDFSIPAAGSLPTACAGRAIAHLQKGDAAQARSDRRQAVEARPKVEAELAVFGFGLPPEAR